MTPVTRRHFLTTTAGLAGILATGVPPARGQQREISYLCWNNFAPASDKKLAEIGQRFTKDTGIKLKIDHISHMGPQQAKYASEVQTQSGHDLVEMRMHFPWLYEPQLVDVSDLVAELEKKYGKAHRRRRTRRAHVNGVWRARAAVPRHVRRDLSRGPLQEGEPEGARHLGGPLHGRQGAEEDGESRRDPHRAELRLDLDGRPRAVVVRRHGGRQGRQDGAGSTRRPPCRRSSGTRRCTSDCMEPEVLSWSDASNNESIQQGKAGWIHNPVSAYIVAKQRKLVTADGINHHRSLAGPNGRHETDTPRAHRHLEVLEEHRAGQGVDPLPPRQEGGLRRVHHVRRRLQPAGLREAPGPSGAEDRSEVRRAQGRGRAVPHLRLAGARPRTRCSSSPTRTSCPT